MWSSIKSFCKLLDIDDEKLFSKQKSTLCVNTENNRPEDDSQQRKTMLKENPQAQEAKAPVHIQHVSQQPLTPQSDSNHVEGNQLSSKSIGHKRASQAEAKTDSDEMFVEGSSAAKCPRLEATYSSLHRKIFHDKIKL